jgi:hypothetical protein
MTKLPSDLEQQNYFNTHQKAEGRENIQVAQNLHVNPIVRV